MTRVFTDFVYGEGPRDGCYWDSTVSLPEVPVLDSPLDMDVAIIGAGFTGLNTALRLAELGARVCVLEAHRPGWGASGRNGGFCCLGGGIAQDQTLDRRFGKTARLEWRAAEKRAVDQVAQFLASNDIDADVHSKGETWLAHSKRSMRSIDVMTTSIEENYGSSAQIHTREDLLNSGIVGPFHGGLTVPIGFGLNPRKYLGGLLKAALSAGVDVRRNANVQHLERLGNHWVLKTPWTELRAEQVVIATNGYSSEDIPAALAARFMPAQSNVIVTRPLTQRELETQGWSSRQICYDSRELLHYFRLLPDNRFLFGMRGGLSGTPKSEQHWRKRVVQDFARMFPAWADVDVTHAWSGLISLSSSQLPYADSVPDCTGLWAGLSYHGNGVAMASFVGRLLGDLINGDAPELYPEAIRQLPTRFPFGRRRRLIMPPLYAWKAFKDMI